MFGWNHELGERREERSENNQDRDIAYIHTHSF